MIGSDRPWPWDLKEDRGDVLKSVGSAVLVFCGVGLLLVPFGADFWSGRLRFSARVPSFVEHGLLRDLDELRMIQGRSAFPIHDRIFGPLKPGQSLGDLYHSYITQRITHVGWRQDSPYLLEAGWSTYPGWIFATPMFAKGLDTSKDNKEYILKIKRWAALLHEAFHNDRVDGVLSKHIPCTPVSRVRLVKNGEKFPECDSARSGGAYVAEVVFFRNMEIACDSCSIVLRTVAGEYASSFMWRIRDSEPLVLELWPRGTRSKFILSP